MAEPMTKPYRPANGTDGDMFMAVFCNRCKFRETGDDACPILIATMFANIGDPEYPKEWVVDEGDVFGKTSRCTAFEAIQ